MRCKAVGTLKTRHGRTLGAMPRFTIQTSPRLARGKSSLFGIHGAEQFFRRLYQSLLGQVSLGNCWRAAKNL